MELKKINLKKKQILKMDGIQRLINNEHVKDR